MGRVPSEVRNREAPLLPREDQREAILFFIIATLCFMATLIAILSRLTYDAASDWTEEVRNDLTVLVRDVDVRAADEAAAIVGATPGVVEADRLSREEFNALVEQSQPGGGAIDSVSAPFLIDVVKSDDAPEDIRANIARRLTEAGFDASVVQHTDADLYRNYMMWLAAIRWTGFAMVGLLTAIALAVIASSTHSTLLARREVVNVLHVSGAEDRMIAGLFARRFWLLGLRAGIVGALFALGVAALLVYFTRRLVGNSAFLPEIRLGLWDVATVFATPVIAAVAARLAARLTVMRTLRADA